MLTDLFSQVLAMSLAGSAVIGVILLLRLLLGQGPKRYICLLWLAMVFRLLIPQAVELPISMERGMSSAEMLVHSLQQTVMEDTVTLYSHSDAYAAGIQQGRQPLIHKASGAFYLLAGEDDGQIPDTAKDVLFPKLGMLWLAGAAVFALWNLVRWICLHRKLTGFLEYKDYRVSDQISTPFVMGLIRPRIYLPSGLDGKERTMVLTHEQCHIRRCDPWLKLLLLTALGIHWFNPAVWVGYWAAVQDMELACDEAALRKLGTAHRADYAQTLLRLSTGRNLYAQSMTGFGAGAVKRRIICVLNGKRGSPLRSAGSFLLCAAMLPLMVVDAAPPWPVRWVEQLREESVRITIHPQNEYSYADETLRQKQRENLMGFLQSVEEDQLSRMSQIPLIQAGTVELVAGTERYEMTLAYNADNGRAHLVMSHCGGPEDAYLIENVPLITFVEHLFSHYRCGPIHPWEVTPEMVLVDHYREDTDTYIYVYQTYCQTCQMYGTQYMARGIGPILFGKKME